MPPKTRSNASKVYTPAMDWWLAVGVVILLLLIAAFMLMVGLNSSLAPRLIVAFVGFLAGVSIVDKAFFTEYILLSDHLVVHSQLRQASFPYRQMTKIRPGSFFSLFTVPGHKRFALGGNCLVIEMSKNFTRWKSVSVSPSNREGFLNELVKRIDAERSLRVTSKEE